MTEHRSQTVDTQVSGSLTGNTIGRFVIGKRLGKGGMGEVYRAEDTRLKRTVALENKDPAITAKVASPWDHGYSHQPPSHARRGLSQWVQPVLVASLVPWLPSEAGKDLNGAIIPVYGGGF